MIRVGILVVATGKYISFVGPLWKSVKKNFLVGKKYRVEMFVFTDSKTVPKGTKKIFQEHKTFPYATLLRYNIFHKNRKVLEKLDYLYYLDADMLVTGEVGVEILGKLVGTIHPGFYDKKRKEFTYETRKISTAYINPNEGKQYFCGGFNGGRAKDFLLLSKRLSQNIDIDLKKNVVAIHNDESHLNRYFIDHSPTVILHPDYCYPEEKTLPFEKKIIALKKDHEKFRYHGLTMCLKKILKFKDRVYAISRVILRIPYNFALDSYSKYSSVFINRFSGFVTFLYIFSKAESTNNIESKIREMDMDIVSVAFNNPEVIKMQIIYLKKYLKDRFILTIGDNSNDEEYSNRIKQICSELNVGYLKLPKSIFTKLNIHSKSHGAAITWLYYNLIKKRNCKYFGFLDHDVFPIKKTSLVNKLVDSPIYGLIQQRGRIWYLWPGFCFFKNTVSRGLLNFMPGIVDGQLLDTGGMNWNSIYKNFNPNSIKKFKFVYKKLFDHKYSQIGSVEILGDWIHLSNSSNWLKTDDDTLKLKSKMIKKLLVEYD